MALISFIDFSTGQRIGDNILVDFYLSTDVNLTQKIDSGYTLNGVVNALQLNAGYDYIVTFTGPYAPSGLYYVAILPGTDDSVVTLNHPASSVILGNPVGPVGPIGEQGPSGLFVPPTLVFPFTVGNYLTGKSQLLVLTDSSPFPVGSVIQLVDYGIGKSGVWQVMQTNGSYNTSDGTFYNLQRNQLIVYPVDLGNLPQGFGCSEGDIFRSGMTKVVYGAPGSAGTFSSSPDVSINDPQNNDILIYQNGKVTNLPGLIYEISTYCNNVPTNQVILRYVFSRLVILNGGLGQADVQAFEPATFILNKNKTQIGTLTFYPDGSTACTLSGSTPVSFTYRDMLEIVSPANKDVSLENIAIIITGFRG